MTGAERGFTLTEVLVALVILGLVLIGGLNAVEKDLSATGKAASAETAAALADQLLARAELLPATKLAALAAPQEGRFEPPLERYTWRASAWPVPGEVDLHEVQAVVLWPGGQVAIHSRVSPAQ